MIIFSFIGGMCLGIGITLLIDKKQKTWNDKEC
jgi:uncharacterized protein involved in exopolysaccharide biosynthesis